jgi:hypothetical protein
MTFDVPAFVDDLPAMPAELDEFGAGVWTTSVLLKTAAERGWSHDDIRRALVFTIAQMTPMGTKLEDVVIELEIAMRAKRRH